MPSILGNLLGRLRVSDDRQNLSQDDERAQHERFAMRSASLRAKLVARHGEQYISVQALDDAARRVAIHRGQD